MKAILQKEFRSYLRGNRAFTMLSIYLFILSGLCVLIYAGYNDSGFADRSDIGLSLYVSSAVVALFQLTFFAPSLNASSLGSERDRQTIDVLMVTPVRRYQIVLGKLIAPCLFLFLLSLATLPIGAMALLIGGIEIRDLLIALAIQVVTVLGYGTVGIWGASWAKTSRGAMLATLGLALVMAVGLPLLALLVLAILSNDEALFKSIMNNGFLRNLGVVVLSFSPFFSLVMWIQSISEGNATLWTLDLQGQLGGGVILQPWVISVLIWLVLIPFLIWRSSKQLQKSVARSSGG
ncbi:ABC transporter permease [Herpetosiphon giganteus]|uniref:ABC transporter permease n=1 Tax=Herpetosiphon giganteus TaxID=2029754 RepID=UPI00195C3F8D|nr:ABC transporter permease subunit [Herpetosiphon giganteus]MBM7846222.1 ABC-type transport system involved in multi-copper enzyme maturation permease subunit [Herpetosiphon giganteus]